MGRVRGMFIRGMYVSSRGRLECCSIDPRCPDLVWFVGNVVGAKEGRGETSMGAIWDGTWAAVNLATMVVRFLVESARIWSCWGWLSL